MGSGFLREFVTSPLAIFFSAYPRIRVELVIAQADEIVDAVVADVAEIGVVFGAIDDPSLNVLIDAERPISFIVAPEHPLAQKTEVTLEEVSKIPLGLPPSSSGIRQVTDKAFEAAKITLEPLLTVSTVDALIQFAAMGAGGTFLPAFSCRKELLAGTVVAVPVSAGTMLRTKAVVFSRQERHLSPAAVALLNVLENTLMLSGSEPKSAA
ncbi:hypothetical protein ATY79_18700 [Rhizobium sp. R693]|nr:hypothetical protein ATY79_18700 [Rhizobium sp. R693]